MSIQIEINNKWWFRVEIKGWILRCAWGGMRKKVI